MAQPPKNAQKSKGTPTPEGEEAPAKKKPWLLIVGILVLVLAAGGGAAWYFTKDTSDAPEVPHPAPTVLVPLERFTVNLQESGGASHLQLEMTLKVIHQEAADDIKLHLPEIKYNILKLLSDKTDDDLAGSEGKEALSNEITDAINRIVAPTAKAHPPAHAAAPAPVAAPEPTVAPAPSALPGAAPASKAATTTPITPAPSTPPTTAVARTPVISVFFTSFITQ